MSESTPSIAAWTSRPELLDETVFTPWADQGWSSHNGQSPEHEYCLFAGMLAKLLKPRLVVETGVGQGYVTRAVLAVLGKGQRFRCYESDDDWRAALSDLPVAGLFAPEPTPPDGVLKNADLVLLDSAFVYRLDEIERWWMLGKPGSVALIHDTGEHHDETTSHEVVRSLIADLGVTGVFLHNPRGSFLAFQT